jgi:hypothetical protein
MAGFQNVAAGAQNVPVNDDAELGRRVRRLPKESQARIKAAEARDRERSAVLSAHIEKVRDLQHHKNEISGLIGHLQAEKEANPNWTDENETNLRDLIAQSADAALDIEALSKSAEPPPSTREQKKRARLLNDLCPPWQEWLMSQPRTRRFRLCPRGVVTLTAKNTIKDAVFDAEVIAPPFKKSDDVAGALASVRETLNEKLDQYYRSDTAKLDIETVLRGLDRELDAIAAPPDVSKMVHWWKASAVSDRREMGRIEWPEDTVYSASLTNPVPVQRGTSFVVWLFRDKVREALATEISKYIGRDGISIPERKAKLAALEIEMLELMRLDVGLVTAGQAAGLKGMEPRTVHPQAMLMIEADDAAEAKEKARIDAIGEERAKRYTTDRRNVDGYKVPL